MCRIERTRERAGTVSREIARAVTSLSPERANPDVLLALRRVHWLIENCLHWQRDVTLREDRSTVRSGTSPRAIAALLTVMLAIVQDAAEPPNSAKPSLRTGSKLALRHEKPFFRWPCADDGRA